jgi:hypothetical protein
MNSQTKHQFFNRSNLFKKHGPAKTYSASQSEVFWYNIVDIVVIIVVIVVVIVETRTGKNL